MNEADIPIDVHTLKLQDWLISRRIVPKNFQNALKDIRQKISNALEDMPSNDELIQLLTGTSITYSHCKQIVEILKKTEKGTKSIFGNYGSQRMKDWLEILRLYETDNVYLAELAYNYVRNVKYEIPGVRKEMLKLEQQREECLKKCKELNKPEKSFLSAYDALLKQIGIKGDNLQEEFTNVLATLPTLLNESIKDIKSLGDAIDLYTEMSDCTASQCLPIIRHLMEFGNTTVYQYIYKEAPLSVEEPPFKLQIAITNKTVDIEEEASTNDNEIDFGGDDNGGGTSSTVSAEIIDADELNLTENGADIDWGNAENIQSTSEPIEINFDIPLEEYGIVMEATGMDGGIAKGDQAYTILDSPTYRGRFLDELYELEAFIKVRLFELKQLEFSSKALLFTSLDDIASKHDKETLQKMLSNVNNILKITNSEHTCHLFHLKHSSKYAQLLTAKLDRMLKAVERIREHRESLTVRAEETKNQRLTLNPVLDDLIIKTKQLQQQIEQDISKRYKNRVVNLLGSGL